MDIIRNLLKNPVILAAGSFFLGLIIGLVVLGWGLWPLQWEDAAPVHLRDDLQQDYVRMMVDSYAKNNDQDRALARWQELGENKATLLQALQSDPTMNPEDVAKFANMVQSPISSSDMNFPSVDENTGDATATDPGLSETLPGTLPTAATETKSKTSQVLITVISCLLMLAFAGAFAYVMLVRRKKSRTSKKLNLPVSMLQRLKKHRKFPSSMNLQILKKKKWVRQCSIYDDLYDW